MTILTQPSYQLEIKQNSASVRRATIRGIQGLCHCGFIGGVFLGTWRWWLISYTCYAVIQIFAVSIGLHRLLAHRSFQTQKWKEMVVSLLSVFAVVGSPTLWVGVHRLHHEYSDHEKDPHSPKNLRWFQIYSGNFYNDLRLHPRFITDLLRDGFQKFLHRPKR